MTRNSKCRSVCARTLSTAWATNRSALYMGIKTETSGAGIGASPDGSGLDRLADQQRVLAGFQVAQAIDRALAPSHVADRVEAGFAQPAMKLVAVVNPLVPPPAKHDVEHLSPRGNELPGRLVEPRLVVPPAARRFFDQ